MPNPDFWDGSLFKGEKAKKGRPGSQLKRAPISQQSEAQKIRTAFLQGIRAERIAASVERGQYRCSRCRTGFMTFAGAWEALDLHHEKKRAQGQGYRVGKGFGVDDPTNLILVCRPCHDQLEGKEKGPTGGSGA